jgi:hypothetical protein
MLALMPFVFIVAMIVIPLTVHARSGFAHVDDSWTDADRETFYRQFDR